MDKKTYSAVILKALNINVPKGKKRKIIECLRISDNVPFDVAYEALKIKFLNRLSKEWMELKERNKQKFIDFYEGYKTSDYIGDGKHKRLDPSKVNNAKNGFDKEWAMIDVLRNAYAKHLDERQAISKDLVEASGKCLVVTLGLFSYEVREGEI